jgi:hypothetical protein
MSYYVDFLPLNVQCNIGFSSDWFYYHAGTTCDEATMRDPLARLQSSITQQRCLESTYPEIFMRNGTQKPESYFYPGLGAGVTTLAQALGARVRFEPHMDPTAIPSIDIASINVFEDIKVPDVREALGFILAEIDTIVDAGYSKQDIGMPNLQGTLNIAIEAFGDTKILAMIASKKKEDAVRHVFGVVSEVFIEAHRMLRRELGRAERGGWTEGGCTFYYISSAQWTRFVLPLLQHEAEELGPVDLHHCGNATEDQLEAYGAVPFTGVEFGFGTDIAIVREKIRNPKIGPIPISCRISPYRMLNQPSSQIRADVEWLLEKGKGGPMSITVVGCPNGTPDENLHELWNSVTDFNERKEAEEGE